MIEKNKKIILNSTKTSIKYRGNVIVLCFFLIFWFPISLILLFKNAYSLKNNKITYLSYHGNYFWLYFWAIFLFPIAMILIFVVGFDQVQEEILKIEEDVIHRS